MKINYEKIKGKAILPLDEYNLHIILLTFVFERKLPITEEQIYSDDLTAYNVWCKFLDKVRRRQHELGKNFAIALDSSISEGCVYGDIEDLKDLGYEAISVTEALDELPNMCKILGVTPNETLEEKGILPQNPFSPHRVTLDGIIRANNDGCPAAEEVIDILTNIGFISDGHNALNAGYIEGEHDDKTVSDEEKSSVGRNGLYELFGLSKGDFFTIKGKTYEGFSSDDNLKELLEACEENTGLIYDLINHPEKIQKAEVTNITAVKKVPERLQMH